MEERELVFKELTQTHSFGSFCIDDGEQSLRESKPDGSRLADKTALFDRRLKVHLTQLVDIVQRREHLLASTQTQYNM